jgi:prolyl-tRNA editing enzyme YbaK/EbsC (Cys-tRNA(Pro) deacylase)/uncharacterized damage-inducible protein DinB
VAVDLSSPKLLEAFAERNHWNFERLAGAAAGLDPVRLAAEARGSYGSIFATLVHVVAALDLWLRRLHGESPARALDATDLPGMAACAAHMTTLTRTYAALLEHLDGAALGRRVEYRNTAGETRHMLAGEILLQVMTHTSDHLAQVATLLTQAGVEPPGLDFVEWVLEHRAAPAAGPDPDALRVQRELELRGYASKVMVMPASTHTSAAAAAAIGCEVGQIAKSLVFRAQRSGDPILVVASGPNRVSTERLAQLLYEPITLADPEFVRQHTGFKVGGVPPLAHPEPMVTLVDEDLLRHQTIWAAAGTPYAVFSLTPAQLVEMTGGRVCRIT